MAETDSPDFTTPARGSKDGYLQTFFYLQRQLGILLLNVTGPDDLRIDMYVDLIISTITDEAKQELTYTLKEQRVQAEIAKYCNENNIATPDAKTRNQIINRTAIRLLGDVTAWYDGEMGITHNLVIGTVE